MKRINQRRATAVVIGVAVSSLALSACGGSDSGGGDGGGKVTLSFLVDNSETSVATAQGLADAYHEKNPDVTIEVEQRQQGVDGDNVV